MVDIQIDPDIPYIDAKTAAVCVGGPVQDVLMKANKLDYCWTAEQVVPHIFKMHKDKKVVMTLGKAPLWVCFDAAAQDMVPLQIIKKLVTAYQRVQNQLEQTDNPVHNVPLVICSHGGQLIIEEIFEGYEDTEDPAHDENNSPSSCI